MNVRLARKNLEHRTKDVIACLRWKRYIRLHLASNLVTELATSIEYGTRDPVERTLMVSLKSAVLSKDRVQIEEIIQAWTERRESLK